MQTDSFPMTRLIKAYFDKHVYVIQAVQPSTGDIIHDCFEDNSSRSELETRLAHIQPVEILLSQNVSEATMRLVTGLQAIRYPLKIIRINLSIFQQYCYFLSKNVRLFALQHLLTFSQQQIKMYL